MLRIPLPGLEHEPDSQPLRSFGAGKLGCPDKLPINSTFKAMCAALFRKTLTERCELEEFVRYTSVLRVS